MGVWHEDASKAQFGLTRWSLILAAQDTTSPTAEAALAKLCEAYWYPIYAFLRRKGHPQHQAEDLTQGFFAHVLRREWLRNVGPEKGRFRTFVLKCLSNYVANQPRVPLTIPIDFTGAEESYSLEPVDHITPDQLFEMRWAVALLDRALERLRREENEAGRGSRFEVLMPYLSKETAPGTFADISGRLQISQESARQEASRLRKRYRQAIRLEISETVAGTEQVEGEIAHLMQVLSR